jgi:predicted TIM-barrel fold metal-dependent hydrolase
MTLDVAEDRETLPEQAEAASPTLAVIDCDVHPVADDEILRFLPKRWSTYLSLTGRRNKAFAGGVQVPARPRTSRLDAVPPSGGVPGTDPDFARSQLLEEYGISAAILNNVELGTGNAPVDLDVEMARATNDYNSEVWLEADSRWFSSITVCADHPEEAIREIERCREMSDRFVQVLLQAHTERPHGNPKYWPIYEAAAHFDLPIAVHVFYRPSLGASESTYYYEMRAGLPMAAQSMATSLVVEGVLERWPTLKVVAVELGWAWALPLAWRMDASWRVLREEVPHLSRKPSEYLQQNFWFTTQPFLEPTRPRHLYDVLEQWQRSGFGDRLMYSSDYPHWDMDPPHVIPRRLPREMVQGILSRNAANLYGVGVDVR